MKIPGWGAFPGLPRDPLGFPDSGSKLGKAGGGPPAFTEAEALEGTSSEGTWMTWGVPINDRKK